jgi:hypothetical protein
MTAFRLLVPALVTCATAIVGVATGEWDASLDLKVQAVDPGHRGRRVSGRTREMATPLPAGSSYRHL